MLSKYMKKTITYFSFLMLIAQTVFAQYPSGGGNQSGSKPAEVAEGKGKISGVTRDSTTKQPVEYANVALNDPNTNKPVNGTVCDDKGKFSVHKIPNGKYIVVISFIGYESRNIPIEISDKNDDIDLGVVQISPTAAILREVVIEGQKTLIEEKVDRTIYNAENDATTRGGDATDVLKRVPMLSVDLDGNVSLRGSSNIKVLVNNKPSTIMASSVADALKQIPADQIKTVEVITSPSAKYDAEGSSGIINIITKKNNLQGLTLNIDGSAGLRGSNLGLNGNYRKKKMGFSIGGWGRANYNVHGNFENTQIINPGQSNEVITIQKADTRNQGTFGHYNLGWDYDVNKNNSIAASVRFGLRNNTSFQDNLTTQRNQEPGSTSDVKIEDLSNNVDASLNYTHTFAKPQREFSILTLFSRNNRTNDYFNTVYLNNTVDIDSIRKNLNTSYNQEITVQTDYQTPVGETQMFEIGAKNISRKVSSDYKYFVAHDDGVFNPSTSSTQRANVFDYTQNVTAGYLSYTLTFLKSYSLKAGARYEYTSIGANYGNTEETLAKIPSYGVLVPSVNFSKKLKNGNTLKLSYNRRIQRPSIQFLNPSVQNSNNLNYTKGNPNLSPEYTNNYELSYSTYIKGSSLNFSSFMRNSTGSIQSVRQTLANGGIETTYKNIGQEDAYGVSVFANVNIGGKFSLNGGSDLYYAVLKNNVDDVALNASNQGWVVSYRLFGNYDLGKNWGAQFFGFYRGRRVQLQGTQGGFGIYSLGLKKDFNEKKGSIGFGAENFFTPGFKIKNATNSAFISQRSVTTLHNMNFKITFSYRIGKMSFDAPKRRRRSINNDDLKDGGGDNQNNGAGMQQTPVQQTPQGPQRTQSQGSKSKRDRQKK
jgi:outer membrane receptor protein involved in Fe transport